MVGITHVPREFTPSSICFVHELIFVCTGIVMAQWIRLHSQPRDPQLESTRRCSRVVGQGTLSSLPSPSERTSSYQPPGCLQAASFLSLKHQFSTERSPVRIHSSPQSCPWARHLMSLGEDLKPSVPLVTYLPPACILSGQVK